MDTNFMYLFSRWICKRICRLLRCPQHCSV